MTVVMNWAVHRWDQINAIKKNISDANRLAFVFQYHGIAMVSRQFLFEMHCNIR